MRHIVLIAILAVLALPFSAGAQQSKPAEPVAAQPAPAPNPADLQFTPAENESLNTIIRAGQAQDSEHAFVTTVLEAADKSLRAARWPNAEREIQKAGEQRLMGLKLLDKLNEDSKKLQGQFDGWLSGVRARAKCVDCDANLQTRRLVPVAKPQTGPKQ